MPAYARHIIVADYEVGAHHHDGVPAGVSFVALIRSPLATTWFIAKTSIANG